MDFSAVRISCQTPVIQSGEDCDLCPVEKGYSVCSNIEGGHAPFAHILDRGSPFVASSVVAVNIEKNVVVTDEPYSPRQPLVGLRAVC